MKKLLFVAKYPLNLSYNLKTKFNSQISAFENMGFDVHYIAFDDNTFYDISKLSKKEIFKYSFGKKSYYIHTKAFCDMYKAAYKVLDNSFSYIYIRDDAMEYYALRLLKKARRLGVKVVCEVPTYPPYSIDDESLKRKILLKISDMFKKRANTCIDLYATIGQACNGHYKNRPAMNINNGINANAYALRQNKCDQEKINLIAVASMSKWQGYDRLIKGIAECAQKNRLKLYLIGDEGDGSLNEWKNLVKQLKLNNIVEFLDPLYGNDLNHMMNKCDLAIAGLALFRKGMTIASTLKLGEYMSRGIPFAYATEDSRFDESFKYCIKLDESEENIPINLLIAFAEQFKKDLSHPKIMREYALAHMTWEAEFKNLFEFFNEKF